jgi:Kef-type K+ transport system membrane component KefB
MPNVGGTSQATVENVLLLVLIQLSVIITAARIAGIAFRRLGQPHVCGEVAAGLLLGPSFFGRLQPELFHRVFAPSVAPVLSILSQIGLILLMFIVGLEFDFGHLRKHARTAIATSLAGIALPFTLGLLVAQVAYPWVGQGIDKTGFLLFLATALSITAIPVLGRIMIELNIHRSPLGSLTITAAALDDALGWIILTMVASVVRSRFSPLSSLLMVAETVGYGIFMFFVARPLLKRWVRRTMEREGPDLSMTTLTVLLVVILASAIMTNLIGIFSVFGAFLAGVILHDEDTFRHAVALRMRDFTTTFFLPLFFAYTGLRTDMGTMQGSTLWLLCLLIIVAAIAGKLGGCGLAARFIGGLSWRDSATVGILMNTRGLMELIVINLGFELGVIPKTVFFMLVLMAIVTTYMTTPLVRLAIRNTPMEALVEGSSFVAGNRRPETARVPQ